MECAVTLMTSHTHTHTHTYTHTKPNLSLHKQGKEMPVSMVNPRRTSPFPLGLSCLLFPEWLASKVLFTDKSQDVPPNKMKTNLRIWRGHKGREVERERCDAVEVTVIKVVSWSTFCVRLSAQEWLVLRSKIYLLRLLSEVCVTVLVLWVNRRFSVSSPNGKTLQVYSLPWPPSKVSEPNSLSKM